MEIIRIFFNIPYISEPLPVPLQLYMERHGWWMYIHSNNNDDERCDIHALNWCGGGGDDDDDGDGCGMVGASDGDGCLQGIESFDSMVHVYF